MANLTVRWFPSLPTPTYGYTIKYGEEGSDTGTWTTIPGITTAPISGVITYVISVTDGLGYEGVIQSECSPGVYSGVSTFFAPYVAP